MNKKGLLVVVGIIILSRELIFSASGTSGVAFVKVSPSARASGMAEAFVGVADDSAAIWYNPAGLAQISKLSVGGSYGMLFEGLGFQYVSFAYPIKGQGVAAANIMMTDYGSIKGYDTAGNPTKNFNAKDIIVAGGYAMSIQPGLSVGGVVKMIQSTIESKSNSAISLDAGVLYKMDANTALGISLKNIIGALKYDEEQVKLPMLIKAGVGYNVGHIV
ncbi:MAG: PorV/PorQ family protein, partial [Endomicrobia bacterium]|nr:PorV/PorQ family protein [Endomicrobiia bacterium]